MLTGTGLLKMILMTTNLQHFSEYQLEYVLIQD